MSGDYVERLRSFLAAHRPDSARHVTADVLATLPNPDGRGWRHLTGADLTAALDELEQLRDETVLLRHDAKRCTAVYDHRLHGERRCEMPTHGRKGHRTNLPEGWMEWDDDAIRAAD